jgi:hypothetical protein
MTIRDEKTLLIPIIQQKLSRRIGHLESFAIEQVFNFLIGQVSYPLTGQMTNLLRSARDIASARLDTPILDRILLT